MANTNNQSNEKRMIANEGEQVSCQHHHDGAACQHTVELCMDRVPLFSALSDEEKRAIVDTAIHRSYQKGELVFSPGEISNNMWMVTRGQVKISKISADGKEQAIRILTQGEFTGEHALFKKSVLANAAEALSDTEICLISGEAIRGLLLSKPETALKFLEKYAEMLERTEEQVEQISFYNVEERLARVLLRYGSGSGNHNEFTLPVSKRDLASMLGTSPETLSRKLAFFEDKRWIRLSGQRTIAILDQKSLEEIIRI